jgi:hypothetical protein
LSTDYSRRNYFAHTNQCSQTESKPSCSQNGKSYDFEVLDKVVQFGNIFDEFILNSLFSAHPLPLPARQNQKVGGFELSIAQHFFSEH